MKFVEKMNKRWSSKKRKKENISQNSKFNI